MPDIRLIAQINPILVTFDWLQLPTNLIDETQQLADAVLVALNTDATADANEILPDPRSDDHRGWWGDLDAQKIWNAWPIGSKLWLLTRAKIIGNGSSEGSTIVRVGTYIRQALQPFIDNRLCSSIAVTVTQTRDDGIEATITIYRGPKTAIQLQYQQVWSEIFS